MNKGFTLVELLAVIILLSVIALITTISTSSTINKSKTKLTEIQIQKIEKAAEVYYLNEAINENNYDYEETKTCVNVEYLIENDYIEENELINPKDYNKMLGSVKIRYESGIYTYNYKDTECNSSDYDSILKSICKPVTEKTKTTGNVPQGNYLPGDEYICEVKPDTKYRFFVLSTNNKAGEIITSDSEDKEITSINLIMNRNVYYDEDNDVGDVANQINTGLVAWVSKENYNDDTNYGTYGNNSKGPITSMNYLNNATKDWSNVPNLNLTYNDEGKHFNDFKLIGKTRLPYYIEVKAVGCLDYEDLSCPIWIIDYLSHSLSLVESYQKNIIDGIHGYWTFSSFDGTSDGAWRVGSCGCIFDPTVNDANFYGVRPVITLEV